MPDQNAIKKIAPRSDNDKTPHTSFTEKYNMLYNVPYIDFQGNFKEFYERYWNDAGRNIMKYCVVTQNHSKAIMILSEQCRFTTT